MNTTHRQPEPDACDPLIDEVRGIRREMCREFGNDVDRLFEHLRQVEQDYAARRGAFAGVSRAAAASVVAGWGEEISRDDDAIVDEVRAIRRGLAEGNA